MIRKWLAQLPASSATVARGILVKVVVAALVIAGVTHLTSVQDQAMHALYQKAEIIKLKLQLTGIK
ncbi:hypothetical protein [Ferrimonas balearica]|uniref:hypothetical protein n=1 Tax=Ferrimonas balearica TaxID=44012 RepID=UPI001C99A8BC|nr:hypothetical protein [Ferrimonas balearica]MBY5921412.1 hypothetical protein [Ferrimonas balearica]MBY5995903.1 hypothetical protein [Ferrimonas balearica]